MKPHSPITAGVVFLLGLLLATYAPAQPSWRLFGSKTPDKGAPGKSSLPDLRRIIEINVEVAWLADPATFPYFLEAHVNASQQLEVRGYVPNRTVRDYALRTAQVYSSLPVVDLMKEHPSLQVRASQMSPSQLQNSVLSSLRVALPKQYQKLKVECAPDGKVFVAGPVNSFEEKIAVSHSLRRLNGCTSVQNLTNVPAELLAAATNPPRDTTSKSTQPPSVAKGTPTGPDPSTADPRKSDIKGPRIVDVGNRVSPGDGPILIPPIPIVKDRGPDLGIKGSAEVIKVEMPTPPTKSNMAAVELQKRIRTACPSATGVEVTLTSATDVRIIIEIRSPNDINPLAERVFAMPELRPYRPDLQFKIAGP